MALRTNSDKRKFQRCHDISKVERIVLSSLVSLLFLLAVSVSPTDSSSMKKVPSLSSDDARHQAVVKLVQKNLLSLFGMKKKPSSVDKSRAAIPKAMLDLYHQQRLHSASPNLPLPGRHTRSANTIRSYTHLESKVDERFPSHHKFRLLFNVSNIPSVEKLTGAELKLTVEVPRRKREEAGSSQLSYRVSADDIVMPGSKSSSTKPILRLIDSKEFRTNDNEVHLDVLPAVQRWLEHTKQNHGILLRVESVSGQRLNETGRLLRLRRSDPDADVDGDGDGDGDDNSWKHMQPFLFLYTDDERYSSGSGGGKTAAFAGGARNKRSTSATAGDEAASKKKMSTGSTNKRRSREACQRHPLYVDFERVGWNDWIVAPPGYEAYHCAGDCPFPLADHLNSTNHAIVQSLMHSMLPQQVPKACCVPTSLAPISMLYLDEENRAVLKNYQDMYVVGCGCR